MTTAPSYEELSRRVRELEAEARAARVVRQELSQYRARFRLLLEQTPLALHIFSPEGTIKAVNKGWEELWQADPADAIGKYNVYADQQAQRTGLTELFSRAARGETITIPDYRYDPKASGLPGRRRWLRTVLYPVKDDSGKVLEVVVMHEDITGRVHGEEKYRLVVENAFEAMVVIQDEQFKFFNRKALEMAGCSAEELSRTHFIEFVHPDDRAMTGKYYSRRLKGQAVPGSYQLRIVDRKGGMKWMDAHAVQVDWEERPAVLAFFSDITARKHSEEELARYRQHLEDLVRERTRHLKESETRFRTFADQAADAFFLTETDGRIIDVNRQACDILGYSRAELLTMRVSDINILAEKKRVRERFWEDLDPGRSVTYETVHRRKNGATFPVEVKVSKLEMGGRPCLLGLARDISERKKVERELLRTQKLESLGVLAGGIAHDFNNLLTLILGNVSLARMRLNPRDKAFGRLRETEKATLRARNLTQQLLTFAQGGAPIKKTAAIAAIIKESIDFALRGSNLRCDYQIPDGLWPVEADAGQISQVFQNLAINAKQAMPDGGTVTIQGRNTRLAPHEQPALPAGEYILITVRDQGTGIAAKHLARIFDPYFTTKKTGSGLGLAAAYSIIKNHDGLISVESKPGAGATFSIYLPASDRPGPASSRENDRIRPGSGRILVMDDETMVRQVARAMLTRLGYEVKTAADGAEALSLYQDNKSRGLPFTVVIMDLTIPGGMGGREAAAQLLKIDPEAKIIVSSGYANDPIMADFKKYGFRNVIPKPYRISELGEIIHQVIQAGE